MIFSVQHKISIEAIRTSKIDLALKAEQEMKALILQKVGEQILMTVSDDKYDFTYTATVSVLPTSALKRIAEICGHQKAHDPSNLYWNEISKLINA